MGMGFAPTWLRQVSPPTSQNHFNHCTQTHRQDRLQYTAPLASAQCNKKRFL